MTRRLPSSAMCLHHVHRGILMKDFTHASHPPLPLDG